MGQGPNNQAEALLDHFLTSGFHRADPEILQPVSVFLDQAGEDIRGRLYLTSDSNGAELCLRPEFTVPLCRDYLASGQAGEIANYCYMGPVFRLRPAACGEFLQAGVESFGRTDIEAADADILGAALEACAQVGAADLKVRFGDAGLFGAFLESLGLPPAWLRRIRAGLAQGRPLAAIFQASANASTDARMGVLAALAGADKMGAKALVEDLLSIAGISSVGGRTVGEIAERFLEQTGERDSEQIAHEKRALIERFFAVSGDPDQAVAQLRALAQSADLDLSSQIERFETRVNFIAARGLDPAAMHYAPRLSVRLNYYTGFVFEVLSPDQKPDKPVVRGGRYDNMLASLGAKSPIPAVGAAIWIERLKAGVSI